MKRLAAVKEITVYMTVETEPGIKIEFMRNPFGEWNQPSTFGEDYFRVDHALADKLEELWMED